MRYEAEVWYGTLGPPTVKEPTRAFWPPHSLQDVAELAAENPNDALEIVFRTFQEKLGGLRSSANWPRFSPPCGTSSTGTRPPTSRRTVGGSSPST